MRAVRRMRAMGTVRTMGTVGRMGTVRTMGSVGRMGTVRRMRSMNARPGTVLSVIPDIIERASVSLPHGCRQAGIKHTAEDHQPHAYLKDTSLGYLGFFAE